MSQNLLDWLRLFSVPGLGPTAFSVLLKRFHTPGEVLGAPFDRLCEVDHIGAETARAIREQQDETWAIEQMAGANSAGIQILTLADPRYPLLLRQIYAPPPLLFVRGEIEACAAPAVALVGSRSFTLYGRDTAYGLADELARRGITVVSGMALGIDAHVHRGALRADGPTVAVLGSGLDCPYPPENLDLFGQICRTGAAISEFPLGTTPEPHNFPRRNRMISGLSLGVVVVEAGKKSGALITVRHALEQNREVFAVPGPINSGKSVGTNRLIKEGAVLVRTVDDILQEIQVPPARTADPLPSANPPPPYGTLSEEESIVVHALSLDTPLHIDAIAARTAFPAPQALSILLALELSNRVEQVPGKHFLLKRSLTPT